MKHSTTSIRRSLLGVLAAALAVTALPLSTAASGNGDEARASSPLTTAQIKEIREATRQFRDVDLAMAAGYLPTDACAAVPGVGGMGYHFANPGYIMDGVIDPTRPEILLYELDDEGDLKLAGVEYFAADADQDLSTDADRPNLFGQPFDGPMPGHELGMPVHYDLHVWLYTKNPDGLLAAWNPKVDCPMPVPTVEHQHG